MSKEKVLCFSAALLNKLPRFTGFMRDASVVKAYRELVLADSNVMYIDRDYAETEPALKQVIPYVVLQSPDGKILSYQRTKKAGEKRLHGKRSIGIGGHINPIDGAASYRAYHSGFCRELLEETGLVLDGESVATVEGSVAGLIYDESDDVGKVHFGIVHTIFCTSSVESLPDKTLANATYSTLKVLASQIDEFENWSKFIIASWEKEP